MSRFYTRRDDDDGGAYVRLVDGGTHPLIREHRATRHAKRDLELEWPGYQVVLTKSEATDLHRRLARALGKED